MAIPPLRPIDAFPFEEPKGRTVIAMRDPMGVVAGTLVVQPEAFFVASHFDGEHDAAQVASIVNGKTNGQLTTAVVQSIADRFSERCLLHDDRFREAFERARRAFAEAPERPAAHAGSNYPEDAGELRLRLGGILAEAWDQPRPQGDVVGLVAPHIDLDRGQITYARAYGVLRDLGSFDRIVVLGTAHGPTSRLLAPTRKPYATPLGPLEVDLPAMDRLVSVLGDGAWDDEFSHRGEHSIEFQAIFLRLVQPRARVLPILCGSLRPLVDDGVDPNGHPDIERAVEALRAAVDDGRRTLVLAAADLAHVGPRFGGPPLTRELLQRTESHDRAALDLAATRDAAGWHRAVTEGGDPRNVCGLSPIYLLLRVLDRGRGHLISYRRCEAPDQCVTIGAMAFVDGPFVPPDDSPGE